MDLNDAAVGNAAVLAVELDSRAFAGNAVLGKDDTFGVAGESRALVGHIAEGDFDALGCCQLAALALSAPHRTMLSATASATLMPSTAADRMPPA